MLAVKSAPQLGIEELILIGCLPGATDDAAQCVRTILDAARMHRFPGERIVCTVPEGHCVEDVGRIVELLREGKRCGFKTAIDDFGAGFAGLKLLSDRPRQDRQGRRTSPRHQPPTACDRSWSRAPVR